MPQIGSHRGIEYFTLVQTFHDQGGLPGVFLYSVFLLGGGDGLFEEGVLGPVSL